jgi:hypothetical protein
MKLPVNVYNALNRKNHFDLIFLLKLKSNGASKAYTETLDYIKEYVPGYTYYKDYNSFKASLGIKEIDTSKVSPRKTKNIDGFYEVPEDVLAVFTMDFSDYMHPFIVRWKVRNISYDMAVASVQNYFPDWKPYKNYQTFKSIQTMRN